jgi:ABC-type methionine transport system ATPase subunit
MYIKQVVLKNLRSIASADWEIDDSRDGGWHVVIGDNGAGKSTFLRSLALNRIAETLDHPRRGDSVSRSGVGWGPRTGFAGRGAGLHQTRRKEGLHMTRRLADRV